MSQGGFFERWSARKRTAARAGNVPAEETRDEAAPADETRGEVAAEAGATPFEPAPVAHAAEAAADPAGAPVTDEELARLPPVETATREELQAFMRKGVPGALKRAALRRIWMLNPRIRDYVDPALDYAWDFNKAAAEAGPLASADAARLLETMLLGEKAAPSRPPAPESVELAPPPGEAPGEAPDPDPSAAESSEAATDEAAAPEGAHDLKAAPASTEVEEIAPERPRRHGSAAPRLS